MSQEKVDRYKKDKVNRQKIMKKEKIIRRLEITVAAVVLVGLIGWFSVAVYKNTKSQAQENAPAVTTSLDVSAIDAYMDDANASVSDAE